MHKKLGVSEVLCQSTLIGSYVEGKSVEDKGALCFIKSRVNAAVYQDILEHFMLLLTSFMEILSSFSSRNWHLPTLPKAPKPGSMTMGMLCLIGQQTHLT